jgi:hypothetical protein
VGGAPGKIDLYVGKEVVRRNIPNDRACDELIDLIKVRVCAHARTSWVGAGVGAAAAGVRQRAGGRGCCDRASFHAGCRSMGAGRTPPRRKRARRRWPALPRHEVLAAARSAGSAHLWHPIYLPGHSIVPFLLPPMATLLELHFFCFPADFDIASSYAAPPSAWTAALDVSTRRVPWLSAL